MSIVVTWKNESHSVAEVTFSGSWTWSEYDAAWAVFGAMLQSTAYSVDLICDVRQMTMLPERSVLLFSQRWHNRKWGARRYLVVGLAPLLQRLWLAVGHIIAADLMITFYDTPEAAYAALRDTAET